VRHETQGNAELFRNTREFMPRTPKGSLRLEVVTTNGLTTFTENGGPVLVDAGVRVGTGLEGVITSATVKFTAGYVKNKDKLQYVARPGIKGSFNVATGTLSLKGTALPSV
jgi:hypothetical protein